MLIMAFLLSQTITNDTQAAAWDIRVVILLDNVNKIIINNNNNNNWSVSGITMAGASKQRVVLDLVSVRTHVPLIVPVKVMSVSKHTSSVEAQ